MVGTYHSIKTQSPYTITYRNVWWAILCVCIQGMLGGIYCMLSVCGGMGIRDAWAFSYSTTMKTYEPFQVHTHKQPVSMMYKLIYRYLLSIQTNEPLYNDYYGAAQLH